MDMASLVTGLSYCLYLKNELMEQTFFLLDDVNSGKLKLNDFWVDRYAVKNGHGFAV